MVLAALVLVLTGTVYALSERQIRTSYEVPEHPLVVPADSASIARGKHLATIRGCVDCHGEDLSGKMVIDEPAIGRIGGANITRGRNGGALTARDWERAVRHGVRRDGQPMLVMPAEEFTGMSDEDLATIIAYAQSLPAVTKPTLPVQLGPVLRAMAVGKQVNLAADVVDHRRAHLTRIAAEPTATYGAYLAAGCTGCHGSGFSGGKIPGAPPDWKPAANITPTGIGHYSAEDFTRLLRTGRRPDGSAVDPLMPWKLTKEMTDTEITAVYEYLKTVAPRDYGKR
jgi:mono/diheme cytochrome c family protein